MDLASNVTEYNILIPHLCSPLFSSTVLLHCSPPLVSVLPCSRHAALRELKVLIQCYVSEQQAQQQKHDRTRNNSSNLERKLLNISVQVIRNVLSVARVAVDRTTKVLCAECLGQLGAVDPAKISGHAIVDRRTRRLLKSSQVRERCWL